MIAEGVNTAKMLADGDFDRALENAIEFGMIEGAKAERARIASIMRCPEAKGCSGTALMLALHNSVMPLQWVREILKDVTQFDGAGADIVDVAARRAALKLIEAKG